MNLESNTKDKTSEDEKLQEENLQEEDGNLENENKEDQPENENQNPDNATDDYIIEDNGSEDDEDGYSEDTFTQGENQKDADEDVDDFIKNAFEEFDKGPRRNKIENDATKDEDQSDLFKEENNITIHHIPGEEVVPHVPQLKIIEINVNEEDQIENDPEINEFELIEEQQSIFVKQDDALEGAEEDPEDLIEEMTGSDTSDVYDDDGILEEEEVHDSFQYQGGSTLDETMEESFDDVQEEQCSLDQGVEESYDEVQDEHIEEVTVETPEEKCQPFQCRLCGLETHNRRGFIEHVCTEHPDDRIVYGTYESDEVNSVDVDQTKIPAKNRQCPICNKTNFKGNIDFHDHVNSHKRDKSYKCGCGSKFVYRSNFGTHRKACQVLYYDFFLYNKIYFSVF